MFQSGDVVIYFDHWKGFEGSTDGVFKALSFDVAKNLKAGDSIWKDDEPYHGNGKVYGFTYLKIVKVEPVEPKAGEPDGMIKLWFSEQAYTVIWEERCSGKIFTCENEKKLEELIENKKLILMHYNYA